MKSVTSIYEFKAHDKCQLALKLIQLSTVSNLFPLEVVQKCQCCQLCVTRENLIELTLMLVSDEEGRDIEVQI